MANTQISKEYSIRINTVIDFILKNLKGELSLSKLASVANYSPFHFQKIFKQATGLSPRQYIIMMRLENSSHMLIIHRHKSVTEIALDSGFASPSTFARAFKNYFGISAGEQRKLSLREKILKLNGSGDGFLNMKYDPAYWKKKLKVKVVKTLSLEVVPVNAPLSDIGVTSAYKKAIQLGEIHDLLSDESKFIGIINPHQGLYQACISFSGVRKIPNKLNTSRIEAGRFATYKIKGDTLQTFHSLHAFYELWLTDSGYHIRNPFGMEILSKNPAVFPYSKIEREIYIPIEPA